MKAISVFFGERPVLKLMYASMLRASETWRGLAINELEREQLTRLWEEKHELRRAAQPTQSDEKTASAPNRVSSKEKT